MQDRGQAVDLYGIQVDASARVMSLAQGNQILLTRFVFDNARQLLKGGEIASVGALSWLNHGPYLMKGVEEPMEICEVGEVGASVLARPPDSEKARRHVSAESEPVLGWRPAVGQVVPNTGWVLERELAAGGFGEVWLGRHEKLKERRVFKFCFHADRVRSLKREVTLFRLLKERGNHPNIVGIQDVFFDEPPFYIMMDYADGEDLSRWAKKQGGLDKVPLEARLEIVAQMADALQAAHEAGIIHRDVKPSNIIVCGSHPGNLQFKLTGFGIGKVVSKDVLSGVTQEGFTQTMSGTSDKGTHIYMAPELLAGKPASTRSDIYSLGVVLYQLLAGDLTRPPTMDWGRDIESPLLKEDLSKCLAGNPRERFAAAQELAQRLRTLPERQLELSRREAEIAAKVKAAHRKGVMRATAVASGVILLIAALAFWGLRQSIVVRQQRDLADIESLRARSAHQVAETAREQAAADNELAGARLARAQSTDQLINKQKQEAAKLREEVLALRRMVLEPEHPDTLKAMKELANSYSSTGLGAEAISLLAKACELDPKDTDASLTLATWQTWFGQDADYDATRRRLLRQAEGTDQAGTAERAAKAACLRPSTDAALLANALRLAQRAVELGKGSTSLPWYQLSLGLAEYRNGQYADAERSITTAEQTVGDHDDIQGIAHMFHAMTLFRQNRVEEARKLFSQAEAQMPPLPQDENKPIVDGRTFDHDLLIWWMSYKEAKSVLNVPVSAKP
jgi:tRNA A-37 threonylcarbamoyl transferase component Bud32/tetratricopeptide (TPR) repeat protein